MTTLKGEKIDFEITSTHLKEKFIKQEYKIQYKYVYGVNETYSTVITKGEHGIIKQLYETSVINDTEIYSKLLLEIPIVEPINQVVEIGVTSSMQLASTNLAFFIKPYDGRISSGYGYRELWGVRFHNGIDIVAKEGKCYGEPVSAAADGTVVEVNYSSIKGNYIVIQHDFNFKTIYMHFSKVYVNNGDKVSAGDVIGEIGDTGRVTGPHLHFEIHLNEQPQNPEHYLKF